MGDKPLISIIIPIFKVEKYLDRCIDSIVNQRYSNTEIILVDDGSPDDCARKCDEWAEKDNRITVIHKQNGGLSDARNYGIKIAHGEYFSFIDSDDYVVDEFLEILYSASQEHHSDIVECSYVNIYEDGTHDSYNDNSDAMNYSASAGLLALISENPFHQHVWDKLYKRDVVQNIFFEFGKQHEDEFWTYQVFGRAKRITKINHTMYFYFQRESSIMGQGYSLRRLDALEGKWNRQLYIEKNYPELTQQAKLDFFASCMYLMQCVIKYMSGREKWQAVAIIRKYKKLCGLTFKDIDNVHGSSKKYFYMAKINIYLCGLMRAKFNIGF